MGVWRLISAAHDNMTAAGKCALNHHPVLRNEKSVLRDRARHRRSFSLGLSSIKQCHLGG